MSRRNFAASANAAASPSGVWHLPRKDQNDGIEHPPAARMLGSWSSFSRLSFAMSDASCAAGTPLTTGPRFRSSAFADEEQSHRQGG
jgi:hypothetical protein